MFSLTDCVLWGYIRHTLVAISSKEFQRRFHQHGQTQGHLVGPDRTDCGRNTRLRRSWRSRLVWAEKYYQTTSGKQKLGQVNDSFELTDHKIAVVVEFYINFIWTAQIAKTSLEKSKELAARIKEIRKIPTFLFKLKLLCNYHHWTLNFRPLLKDWRCSKLHPIKTENVIPKWRLL